MYVLYVSAHAWVARENEIDKWKEIERHIGCIMICVVSNGQTQTDTLFIENYIMEKYVEIKTKNLFH